MILSKNTGLNNIPTEDQNFLYRHWSETRRALKILNNLVADEQAKATIQDVIHRGEGATTLLRKGQPARRRSLYVAGRRWRNND
jgi:hypothetical protein